MVEGVGRLWTLGPGVGRKGEGRASVGGEGRWEVGAQGGVAFRPRLLGSRACERWQDRTVGMTPDWGSLERRRPDLCGCDLGVIQHRSMIV